MHFNFWLIASGSKVKFSVFFSSISLYCLSVFCWFFRTHIWKYACKLNADSLPKLLASILCDFGPEQTNRNKSQFLLNRSNQFWCATQRIFSTFFGNIHKIHKNTPLTHRKMNSTAFDIIIKSINEWEQKRMIM